MLRYTYIRVLLQVRKTTAVIMVRVLGATVQKFVAPATRRPEIVHPCSKEDF